MALSSLYLNVGDILDLEQLVVPLALSIGWLDQYFSLVLTCEEIIIPCALSDDYRVILEFCSIRHQNLLTSLR